MEAFIRVVKRPASHATRHATPRHTPRHGHRHKAVAVGSVRRQQYLPTLHFLVLAAGRWTPGYRRRHLRVRAFQLGIRAERCCREWRTLTGK